MMCIVGRDVLMFRDCLSPAVQLDPVGVDCNKLTVPDFQESPDWPGSLLIEDTYGKYGPLIDNL